jgi:hypothetical protein
MTNTVKHNEIQYPLPSLTHDWYGAVCHTAWIFMLVANPLPFLEFSHPFIYLSVSVSWVSNVTLEKFVVCDLF